jgi:hypothetical protein
VFGFQQRLRAYQFQFQRMRSPDNLVEFGPETRHLASTAGPLLGELIERQSCLVGSLD